MIQDQILQSGTKGHFLSVTFQKRTDGKIRTINGRFGVRKGVKGIGLRYDPASKGLMVIYDVQKQGFRMISLEHVSHINGRKVE